MSGAAFLALAIFIIIMIIYLVITMIMKSKKNMTDRLLEKKFEEDEDDPLKPNAQKEDKSFLGKLERDLKEGQINMDAKVFLMVFIVISIIAYVGAFYVFGQPLVSFAPLPFTLYFLPKSFLESKKEKQMDRFDSELVQILRRMSSVLKNGSILQALEDVKDLPSLSEKSRTMLNEVYHRYKYGDSIESAFYKVAEKSGSEQFKICAISIDINKEFGSDLSQSINEVALTIQRLRLAKQESKSLQSQTLMIGRILSIVPFFIIGYLVTANREFFTTYLETVSHQLIFMFLFMMMLFGMYFINQISKK